MAYILYLKLQDSFITPNIIFVGDEQSGPIFIGRSHTQEMAKNEIDLDDNKYELPILKYDANQEALVKQKERALVEEEEGTLVEEEGEPKTPSQSTS
jgi:hypothetical protein